MACAGAGGCSPPARDPAAPRPAGPGRAQLHRRAPEPVVGHRPDLRGDVVGGRLRVFHRRRVLSRMIVGWRVAVAHAHRAWSSTRLEMARWSPRHPPRRAGRTLRCRQSVHRRSLRRTPRRARRATPRSASVGDSYDNALAETVNGLYKTELIRGPGQGPWRTVDEVELATLGWVHWHNTERLHSYLGDVPPAEFEAAFYAAQQTATSRGLETNNPSLHQTQGDSSGFRCRRASGS